MGECELCAGSEVRREELEIGQIAENRGAEQLGCTRSCTGYIATIVGGKFYKVSKRNSSCCQFKAMNLHVVSLRQ